MREISNDKCILYIGSITGIPNLSEIGTTRCISNRILKCEQNNPDFKIVKMYNTIHYKELEKFLMLTLKNFRNPRGPDWFYIEENELIDIVDFFFDYYDNYQAHLDINQLHKFVLENNPNNLK